MNMQAICIVHTKRAFIIKSTSENNLNCHLQAEFSGKIHYEEFMQVFSHLYISVLPEYNYFL